MMLNHIYKIIESKIGLLVIGFILTTLVGTYINEKYHQKTWEERQNSELLKRKLDKQESLVNDVSTMISNRAFRLERLLWSLEYHDEREKNILNDKKAENINKLWSDYYSTVISWNENYKMHYVRLKYLAGNKVAAAFYVSENEANSGNTKTLYGKFVQAHGAMLDLRNCVLGNQGGHEEKYKIAKKCFSDLTKSIDSFLFELYISLDENARNIIHKK